MRTFGTLMESATCSPRDRIVASAASEMHIGSTEPRFPAKDAR